MIEKERSFLTQVIRTVAGWVQQRRPGSVTLDWTVGSPERPIVLEMLFDDVDFTTEEDIFLPRHEKIFHLNGNTPPSFQELLKAQNRLNEIGGEFFLSRSDARGLLVKLSVSADESDPDDVISKINLLDQEIHRELQPDVEAPDD